MRLVILCEGYTEEKVLKDFLSPYCPEFSRIDVLNVAGSGNLKQEFKPLAELELDSDSEAIVFCLIDLLEIPFTFPKYVDAAPDPYHERFVFIQRFMRDKIKESMRDRFFAFPVIMELETWLLADEQALNDYFHSKTSNPIIRPHEPESILKPTEELGNLIRRFRPNEYGYKKTIHGPNIFKLASARRVYDDNCPHFVLLIKKLMDIQGLLADSLPQFSIPNESLYLRWAELEQRREFFWQEFEQKGDFTDEELTLACEYDDSLKEQIKNISDQLT
jgi:hypothetical protein